MHILFNGSFWTQPTVGSGQYLHGLLRWLPIVAPQHRYTVLIPAAQVRGPLPPLPASIQMLLVRTPFDQRHANLAKLWFEQISVPVYAHLIAQNRRAGEPVLLHVPYFAPPLQCVVPSVTTIPDVIPLILPEYRGAIHVRGYMRLVCHAAQQSNHVITFSAYSRQDIANIVKLPLTKITPTLLAADERYHPAADATTAAALLHARYGIRPPFIYYVGGLDARKNVATLIRAVALLHQQYQLPVPLVIAGKPLGASSRLFPDLDGLIAALGMQAGVARINVPHADGALLYQTASVFAFPSRYEGFGLPPLEAMACGTPVVCSTASSLPEVVGDAAVLADPDDPAVWARALLGLLTVPARHQHYRQQGLRQAARFTWRRVVEETLQVYEHITYDK